VQVEWPVDFASLIQNGCDIVDYYEAQDLGIYYSMLNGPTYESLVKHFWVRASVYDKKAAKLEEDHKVLIDPSLEGKSRQEMGLEPFVDTEIRSSIMGVLVFINQETIAYVIGRTSKGNFKDGLDNNKKSHWNEVVNETMFNSKKKGSYSNLSMEKKMMLKIQNENLLPKGGGSDQPSLEHRVFLHFFLKKEKANVPKYILKHMVKALTESQINNRTWIPYGRLISEIFYQGGMLKGLSETRGFIDDMLGTVTRKIINGATLANMKLIKPDVVIKLESDMKESRISSNLMEGFPPICKQDPLDVQLFHIADHLQSTGEEIRLDDIPDTMYGGKIKVAKSRKTKRKHVSEAEYLEGASEGTTSGVPSIQEEVEDLQADQVLSERTRKGKAATTSSSAPKQPTIPKKKRKHVVRKLKESMYIEAEEEATELVTREVRRKKINDEAVERAVELASLITVPASNLVKEDAAQATHQVIEAAAVIQELAASEVEVLGIVDTTKAKEGNAGTSEAAETSEAQEGMTDAFNSNIDIVELRSSSETQTNSPSSSSSSSILSSSDKDDVPLSKMYSSINKTPSKTKTSQKSDETFEPTYPSVQEKRIDMQQRRIDACK